MSAAVGNGCVGPQEVYSRAYALKLLASSMKQWTAVGPDGQELFVGGRTVADLVQLLLAARDAANDKSKKHKEPSMPKAVKSLAKADTMAAGSSSTVKKASKVAKKATTQDVGKVVTPHTAPAKRKHPNSAKKMREA
jgi:hypothetical protein